MLWAAGGLPSLGRQGLASLATAYLNQAAGVWGDSAIAAFSVVNRITFMAFSALLLVLPSLVSALALLLACRESWGFSLMLFHGVLPGASSLSLRGDFKVYCLRYLFIVGILLLACLLDAGLSAAFIRFFHFTA